MGERPDTPSAPSQPAIGIDERDRLLSDLYGDLRMAAARLLSREGGNITLQPTELVNEAAIRVMKLERMSWNDRQHFFATSARILRQAMIDAIRRRKAQKRRPGEIMLAGQEGEPDIDVEALDEALVRLERASPELARIVELRFFVGLGIAEIATLTEQSERTIKRRWQTARMWLASELGGAS
jgi:RNA polymerase sigma factor (TIGR02999 family)